MSREILTESSPAYDQRIRYGEDPNQFADIRVPKGAGPHPVVVVVHGGFWRAAYDLSYAGFMSAALTQQGVATWNIEYRRIGQPGGGYPGTLDDAAAAVDHLATIASKYKLDLKHVVALGHSAGGHLALWLATRQDAKVKLTAAVSLAGVGDLRAGYERRVGSGVVAELMGCSPEECPNKYKVASPAERFPAKIPLRLFHGTKDDIVPIAMSEDLEKLARKAGDDVKLIRLEGADHFAPVDPRTPEWQQVAATVLKEVH